MTSLKDAIQKVKDEGKLIPRAIIAVDLFGQPADYEKLEAIAKENNLLLLEDAAQDLAEELVTERHVVSVMHLQHHFSRQNH